MGRELKLIVLQATIGLGTKKRAATGPLRLGEELGHPRVVDVVGVETEGYHCRLRIANPTRCPSSLRSGICRAMILATSLSL